MITVITPTIRKEGLDIVAKSLQKQTWDEWEWLIGSPFDPEIPWATWIKDDFEGGFWTLNRIYNRLFQEAKGELVVSWQDFIYAIPTGLESFWTSYLELGGRGLVSGVGDQYKSLDAFGKPYDKIWSDPRKGRDQHPGSFYECYWNDIEWNWAAIPKGAFFGVGGMDEELDFLGYGGDQLQVCDRLSDTGHYTFWLDRTNESYTLRHERDAHGGQEHWDANHTLFNGKYVARKSQLIKEKQWPILVDFGRNVLLEKREEV
jgi:hypothetical protein